MNVKEEFYRIMATQTEIALATYIANVPNVRIVNFVFDEEEKRIYFSTFGDNEKVKEIEKNDVIAFTTIPHMGNEHVRAKGVARKSERSVFDLAEAFSKKINGYADTLEQVGEYLVLYEISFVSANVILNLESADVIEL